MKSLLLLSLLLLSFFSINSAQAQSIIINASNAPYNLRPALNNISIYSAWHDRTTAVSDAASVYRSSTGGLGSPLKPGVVFKIKYKDGTSENAIAASPFSEFQAEPIPGSQKDANGNPIGGAGGSGGGEGGGGSRFGVIGFTPIYMTATTCVGGVCSSQQVLVGYEPIYGNQAL